MNPFEEVHRRAVSEAYKPFTPPPMNLHANPRVAVDSVLWAVAWLVLNLDFLNFDEAEFRRLGQDASYQAAYRAITERR